MATTQGVSHWTRVEDSVKAFSDMVQSALTDQSPEWEAIAMKVPAENAMSLEIPFFLGYGKLGNWSLTGKAKKMLEAYNISIPIDDKEETFEVRKVQLNSSSALGLLFSQQQSTYAKYYNSLVETALTGGLADVGADGLSTFNASHVGVGGASQDNLNNLTLTYDNLATVIETMRNFKDPVSGQNIGVQPDTVVFGPNLAKEAAEVLQGTLLSGSGGSNVMQGIARGVMLPQIDNGTWYVMDSRFPILIAVHEDIKPVSKGLDGSYSDKPTVEFGVEAHLGVHLPPWFAIYINEG